MKINASFTFILIISSTAWVFTFADFFDVKTGLLMVAIIVAVAVLGKNFLKF